MMIPQQKITLVSIWFSKSPFKDIKVFFMFFQRNAVVFVWNLQRFSIFIEILILLIALASFLSGCTSWFLFLLTWTCLIIILFHYLHKWLTPKMFISHELECDIVVTLICCEIRWFSLVLWVEINNGNTKIIKQIIYLFLLFLFVAGPWIVESRFWNATFSRITTWRSVSQMFVCPF